MLPVSSSSRGAPAVPPPQHSSKITAIAVSIITALASFLMLPWQAAALITGVVVYFAYRLTSSGNSDPRPPPLDVSSVTIPPPAPRANSETFSLFPPPRPGAMYSGQIVTGPFPTPTTFVYAAPPPPFNPYAHNSSAPLPAAASTPPRNTVGGARPLSSAQISAAANPQPSRNIVGGGHLQAVQSASSAPVPAAAATPPRNGVGSGTGRAQQPPPAAGGGSGMRNKVGERT